jgi:hypothetical protein
MPEQINWAEHCDVSAGGAFKRLRRIWISPKYGASMGAVTFRSLSVLHFSRDLREAMH